MYMELCLMFVVVGLVVASIPGFLPVQEYAKLPFGTGFVTFFIGLVLALTGYYILYVRAKKTGAIHIIKPAKKNHTLWFYIFKDDEILITPAVRVAEGFTESKELDSRVPDAKIYTLADHKVRIVPEIIGHAVDVDYVLYVNLLKSKYGIESLQEARRKIFSKKDEKEVSQEHVATGKKIREILGE